VLAPPLEGTQVDDRSDERRVGVDHLAFGVPDAGVLDEVVTVLQRAGVTTEGVEHDPVVDKSYVAFRDPDNVQWEFHASA
jgi:glyoxylase I family protein